VRLGLEPEPPGNVPGLGSVASKKDKPSMKIIVCIKEVPARDSQLRVESGGRWINGEDLSFEINEPDAYALEAALQLKEKHGGEVVALCAGPARASQTIREALAKGADRALHIEDEQLLSWDTLGMARLLAKAAGPERPDLILTGLQSDDLGHGQTGVVLAEILGLPHATIIMAVEVLEGMLRVKRELESGWFQNIEMPLPAVLTIQSGISKLRYATLMGIKKAKSKEIKRLTAGQLGVTASATATIERVYIPQKAKQTQLLEGTAREAAAKLVEKLKFEVRAI
jgi:electron transfer flavoprotein beta subunit